MLNQSQPLVTVGLPVYNGAGQMRMALDSMLLQDYHNFEVVILDNASTDHTRDVAMEYVGRDARVKYFRNEENIGAVNNFKKAFEMRSGKYFAWIAHDDCRGKEFLSKCIDRLEGNPSAILCSVDVGVFDTQGKVLPEQNSEPGFMGMETLGMNVPDRVSAFFSRACCCAVYGVMRSDALKAIGEFPSAFGWDYIFLVKLLLLGDFLRVPERLIYYTFTQKTVGEYMELLFVAGDKPEKAVTDKARKLIKAVLSSSVSKADKIEVLDRFFDFIPNNAFWAGSLTRENKSELDKEVRKYFLKGLLTDCGALLDE